MESILPLTIEAVAVPGLYVDRTPKPAAIPMGVVRPYSKAANIGIRLCFSSILRRARREPMPRPSKVSARFSEQWDRKETDGID